MKLFVLLEEQRDYVQTALIREMLRRGAQKNGIEAEIKLYKAEAPAAEIPAMPSAGDILLCIGADEAEAAAAQTNMQSAFNGKILSATRAEALNAPQALWQKIMAAAQDAQTGGAAGAGAAANAARKIVAVTSCPTGIAHTFMAAEALLEGAKALNIPIRVETQGSVGSGTPLTEQEIKEADLVIIAADREVDRSRFAGKRLYVSKTKPAISNGRAYIQQAMEEARRQNAGADAAQMAAGKNANSDEKKGGFYGPLMTGVSFMLPFVVAGGLLIALGLALGGIHVEENQGTLGHVLWQIGQQNIFPLIVPVLAGYIAFAIADRPALAPGMVGGFISDNIGSGFIGGIIAGFLAGYITKAAIRYIPVPKALAGLKPVLILPLVCTALTGLVMFYIVKDPTAWLLHSLTDWVRNLEAQSNNGAVINVLLLGALIGGMMAADMGGPINKAAYTVAIGLLSVKIYTPMAAAMIGGMVPPLALALACVLRPSRFTEKERESKEATFVMGLAFISEGAIPFATRDPLRVIPCLIAGSAVAGAVAMLCNTGIVAPHGGIFLLPIKNAILNYSGYFAALIGGALTGALCLCFICRPLKAEKI